MADHFEHDPAALRQFLLKRKLGDLLGWQIPTVNETVGPFNPELFKDYDAARLSVISKCRDELKQYSDETIELLASGNADASVRTSWNRFAEGQIDKLTTRQPPWYAVGFGHPEHAADFEHWCKMPSFKIDEALCLSVGIEPANFPSADLDKIARKDVNDLWPALQFLLRRRDQFQRKFDPGHNNWTVRPKDFIAWVEKVDLECDPEFLRQLRQYHLDSVVPSSARGKDKPADKREIDTMAKLFTVMAIDHLGFKPHDKKSPTPKEIADFAAAQGIMISVETVRKYLKRGAEFLPKNQESD